MDSSRRGLPPMVRGIRVVVIAFLGIVPFWLLSCQGGFGPGAPRLDYMPAGPAEAEAGGVPMLVREGGWYGGGYMVFMYAFMLSDQYRGWEAVPPVVTAVTADGKEYKVADALPFGTVDTVAIGVFTLRVPEVGKGLLTLTIPALEVTGPTGRAERLDGPWAVSPVEMFGRQPNPGTRTGAMSGLEIRHGEVFLSLGYRYLGGCPGSFEEPPTPTPDMTRPTATPYQGPGPFPTSTIAVPSSEFLRGMEPDGTMLMAVSVCNPEPRYLAARVTGPDGNLETATAP